MSSKSISVFGLCSVLAGAILAAAPASATNFISNGDFEATGFGSTSSYYNIGQDHAVPGDFVWAVPTGNVDIVANGHEGTFNAGSGSYVLDLVGYGSTGKISQTINGLTVGEAYTVSIDYARNLNGSPVSYAVVFAGSEFVGQFPGTNGWSNFTGSFTATSPSMVFSIASALGSGSGGVYLDNIVVSAATAGVPEPASWALLIAGFGLTGAALRRRRLVAA